MKPVMQTRLHRDGEPPGNCLAACIASILEVPIEKVPWPDSRDLDDWTYSGGYWERLAEYLHRAGHSLVWINLSDGDEPQHVACRPWSTEQILDDETRRGPYYIGTGPGPRGVGHSVVMRDGRLEHDPHPQKGGLVGIWSIQLLVPLEVSR